MEERDFRADLPEEEARKVHVVVYVGEDMLQHAHQVAQQAEERFLELIGHELPTAEGR